MTQAAPGIVSAPGHLWPGHQAVKEAVVQVIKDFFQVIVLALSSLDPLASSHLADKVGFGGHGAASGELAVASRLCRIDGLAIELGDEDVKDSVQHWLGRAFQQIGESHQNASLSQADGTVEVGKSKEANVEFGKRRG